MSLQFLVGAFLLSGTLAIFGSEAGYPLLLFIFKPLTTLMLFPLVGSFRTLFTRLVAVGISFSLVGDLALLGNSNTHFLVGVGGFLLAHVAYIAAFVSKIVWSPRILGFTALVGGATIALVLRVAPGAQGLLLPVIVYAIALSLMVISALSTVGGALPLAPLAAVGAVLFYISDSSLALNRFTAPLPHAAFLTLGVYWLGQLGIALPARGEAAAWSLNLSVSSPLVLPSTTSQR